MQHRTVSLNVDFLMLFKNPRYEFEIGVVSRLYDLPHLLPAYDEANSIPHEYLLVDLSSPTPEEL